MEGAYEPSRYQEYDEQNLLALSPIIENAPYLLTRGYEGRLAGKSKGSSRSSSHSSNSSSHSASSSSVVSKGLEGKLII